MARFSESGSRPLRIWVLSDDQPGHYNLSHGVVGAIALIRPVQVTTITMKLRFGLARSMLRVYLNHLPSAGLPGCLRMFYRMDSLPAGGCDLLVSAGGKTSFANAWLSVHLNVPNVFVGSLRRLSAELFTLVLTLEPIEGADNNLVVTLPPSSVSFEKMQRKGERFRRAHGLENQPCWALLAGGNGAGYTYMERDWLALSRLMTALGQRYGIRWLLVTSRRTGQAAEQLLNANLGPSLIAASCWHGDDYDAEAWLGAAERVFVTEDSMTMLTEAVYSRRPVVSLRPQHVMPTDRYKNMMQRFSDRGLICRYAIAELERQPGALGDQKCNVLQESPLKELSRQLGERLGIN